jgi:uncharacterized protein
MNFTREQNSPVSIRKLERGSITVGQEVVTENVVISRGEILRGLPIPEIADLAEEHLGALLDEPPEIIILGTGWEPQRPPRELVFAMARRGIGFEIMDTPAACRTFNILLSEGRDVAAILLVHR